jgi:hypothetical protein
MTLYLYLSACVAAVLLGMGISYVKNLLAAEYCPHCDSRLGDES